jgi:hypothetical protein
MLLEEIYTFGNPTHDACPFVPRVVIIIVVGKVGAL